MENESFAIILTEKRYLELKGKAEKAESKQNEHIDFEKERLTKPQTAKFIKRSIPYVNKLIKEGILKDYGFGKRGKYLLKSEVTEALRNSNSNL
ncbi:hypothetical protein N9164_07350 [Draconibacterium sp.]|nr:hypothetical protein [Draconibacterium sp.]